MESKLFFVQIALLVGVAVAQTGQQQTFSFSDPALQQVQPLQASRHAQQPLQQPLALRRQPVPVGVAGQQQPFAEVFNRALQHHGPARLHPHQQQAHEQGHESLQFLNSRAQPAPQQVQPPTVFQPVPEQARIAATFAAPPVNADLQRLPDPVQRTQFVQAQSIPARAAAPAPAPFQPPVGAVLAPVQQQDAQVFLRQPEPTFQQQTFTQQRFLEQPQAVENSGQFLTEGQQDFSRFQQSGQQDFQQVSRTRPTGSRARGPPAVPATRTLAAAPSPSPSPAPQQVATQAVRARPTGIQVPDSGVPTPQNDEADALFREQAENAKYSFASAVDDRLTDNSQVRQETRDGLNLSGLYSYSDGFYRRTVHYEADQNGYRVTKEEVEPIGDGPQPNPAGSADVATQVAGADVRYTITADDIREVNKVQRQHQQPQQPQQQPQQQPF